MTIRPLVAGNWKMFGVKAAMTEILSMLEELRLQPAGCDALLCPPFTLLPVAASVLGGQGIALGAQDCHDQAEGAFTGSISAPMLADAGAAYVIVGHSERRHGLGETDAVVRAKAAAAWSAHLTPIVCVGETLQERQAGQTLDVVLGQLKGSLPSVLPASLVIAYEPVWAIGTGLTPSLEDIAQVHAAMRQHMAEQFGESGASTRLLYGGSVKAENAASIATIPHVNGALVGGASLKANTFVPIVRAFGN